MPFNTPVRKIAVLGGGSAGFIAALTLKKKLPQLEVTVLRSPAIGIIGVGEGTTPYFPAHFHDYLKIDQASFYKEAEPIWKLGIRYLGLAMVVQLYFFRASRMAMYAMPM